MDMAQTLTEASVDRILVLDPKNNVFREYYKEGTTAIPTRRSYGVDDVLNKVFKPSLDKNRALQILNATKNTTKFFQSKNDAQLFEFNFVCFNPIENQQKKDKPPFVVEVVLPDFESFDQIDQYKELIECLQKMREQGENYAQTYSSDFPSRIVGLTHQDPALYQQDVYTKFFKWVKGSMGTAKHIVLDQVGSMKMQKKKDSIQNKGLQLQYIAKKALVIGLLTAGVYVLSREIKYQSQPITIVTHDVLAHSEALSDDKGTDPILVQSESYAALMTFLNQENISISEFIEFLPEYCKKNHIPYENAKRCIIDHYPEIGERLEEEQHTVKR